MRSFEKNLDYLESLESLDGILWADAPLPRRLHRCRPRTRSWFTGGSYVERCACGAIRLGRSGRWMEKNERRHDHTDSVNNEQEK